MRRRLWLASAGVLLLSCARSAFDPGEDIELDEGDASTPAVDAGNDAGTDDAGAAGGLDTGLGGFDSGRPEEDAGDEPEPDAGDVPDAQAPRDGGGSPDAGGTSDAGAADAGPKDAGAQDSGTPDASAPDAGAPDAGPRDAGAADAGRDAGSAQCQQDDDCPDDCLPIGVLGCCSNNKCGCTWAPGAYCTL